MEEAEYKEKIKKIESDAEQAKRALHIEYALSNAKFKKGDIIKGHVGTILIDHISTYKDFSNLPQAVYSGIELKKDLTPRKRKGDGRLNIYGHHLVELIKSAEV